MIDCSHANSGKDYKQQGAVCRDIAAQIAGGNRNIVGVMLESNLIPGAQKLTPEGLDLRTEHHGRVYWMG